MEFDAEAAYAAIAELPPICRTAYIRFTWDKYNPQQIVHDLASKGVSLDTSTVKRLLVEATRHCLKRQVEAAERRKLIAQKKPILRVSKNI